jgi:hypothetical protein
VTAAPVTQPVTGAINEIRETFAEATVTVDSDGNGGAWVVIDSVPLGPVYVQDSHLDRFPNHLRVPGSGRVPALCTA